MYLSKTFDTINHSLRIAKLRGYGYLMSKNREWRNNKSSRSKMFLKLVVLKTTALFTEKHMCLGSLFNKVAGLGLQLY